MKRIFPAILASVATVVLMIGLALHPKVYTDAVYCGLVVWATKVLPAMLPYFILTRVLSGFGLIPNVSRALSPLTGRLYRVPGVGGYVYLMSMISGYPVGARVTLDMAQQGLLDAPSATRVATFTSTSGPLFILGTVATLFESYRIGVVILVSHLLAALINGLFYRKIGNASPPNVLPPVERREDAVYSSVLSVLVVGGYIAIFFVLATFLERTRLLFPLEYAFRQFYALMGLPSDLAVGTVSGLLEITKGCCEIAPFSAQYPLAVAVIGCGIVSFGGVCIQLQGWTYLKEAKVKGSVFALSKLTHALVAMVLCLGIGCLIIP